MRIATTPGFSKWLLQRVNHSYPFNELRVTRHGFTWKYVIFEGQYADNRFINNQKHCARPIEFTGHILEQMILQGGCKPLPPVMTNIMDYMYYWGPQKSRPWYRAVLSTLYEMLEGPSPCERKDIFMECIYWLVKERITESYDLSSNEGQIVMAAWHGYYSQWYEDKFSFKDFSIMNEEFVTLCIEDLDYSGGLRPQFAMFIDGNNQP
eukprot:Sro200_g014471.1  (208) ;mRNA; r:852-1475